MKIFLRLLGKVRLGRKLSAVGYKHSAVSCQPSVLNRHSPTQYQLPPKTYTRIPLLLFILVFVSCSAALAQDVDVHSTPAAQAETEITPLKIGDKIPDELWGMYFPVVSANSDQVQYLSLGDFKDKLIILDFWATWCAPCITSLHKLDTLQEQFKDDLMVIPTSYEPESKVKPFLISKTINLSSLIEETELKKYFPHRSIPHQVWIKDGEVLAIAGHKNMTEENIVKAIKKKNLDLPLKFERVDFKSGSPLFINGNGGTGDGIIARTMFSRYIPGLDNSDRTVDYHRGFIQMVNSTIAELFARAFREEISFHGRVNRISFEVSDEIQERLRFPNNKLISPEWRSENVFCYNMILPKPVSYSALLTKMQNDLNSFFGEFMGIKGEIQEREVKCLILVQQGKVDKLKSNNITKRTLADKTSYQQFNQTLDHLVGSLGYANYNLPTPFLNETDIDYPVDLIINAGLRDIENFRVELNKYDLDLIEAERCLNILVIKEKGT